MAGGLDDTTTVLGKLMQNLPALDYLDQADIDMSPAKFRVHLLGVFRFRHRVLCGDARAGVLSGLSWVLLFALVCRWVGCS